MALVLEHPFFWTSVKCVEFICAFADTAIRSYGQKPRITALEMPKEDYNVVASMACPWRWPSSACPEFVYLEHALAW
jgi:hypothetical protein